MSRPSAMDALGAGRRRWTLALVALLTLLIVLGASLDLLRPPREQASARALLGAIHLYQRMISPWMPALGVNCRFQPTCSHYAAAVIARDGALRGAPRAGWRLLRCGPWTPAGTLDPP